MIDAKIQSEFDNAKRIVFLTGAGVSTASGIPDYRSKKTVCILMTRPISRPNTI